MKKIILFLALTITVISYTHLLRRVPPDFVPDEKVVFLKQRIEFGPIRYNPIEGIPYK